MLSNDLGFTVAVPIAGYEWVKVGVRWLLKESEPAGPSTAGHRWYHPDIDNPALFLELAHLKPDRAAIQNFANTYGQLDVNDAHMSAIGIAPELAEVDSVARWINRASREVNWFRSIAQLRHAVDLYGLIRSGAVAPLSSRARWVESKAYTGWQVRNHRSLDDGVFANWLQSGDHYGCGRDGLHYFRDEEGISVVEYDEGDVVEKVDSLVKGPVNIAVLANDCHWSKLPDPQLDRRSSPLVVVDSWLDKMLDAHLNGVGYFGAHFGRDPRSKERCVTLTPSHLKAMVWLQFARSVITKKDLTTDFRRCKDAECNRWFFLSPKERARRVFCSDVCRTRHFRNRKAEAVTLKAAGKSVPQIAAQLEADVSTVKKWLQEAKQKGK